MDRSLPHAEWVTEVQWYRPRLYHSSGFRRLTRVVKHQRVTLWPGIFKTPPFSVRSVFQEKAASSSVLSSCVFVVWFVLACLFLGFDGVCDRDFIGVLVTVLMVFKRVLIWFKEHSPVCNGVDLVERGMFGAFKTMFFLGFVEERVQRSVEPCGWFVPSFLATRSP